MVWSSGSDGKLTDSRRPDFREFLPPRAGLVYFARVVDKELGKAVAEFAPNSACSGLCSLWSFGAELLSALSAILGSSVIWDCSEEADSSVVVKE